MNANSLKVALSAASLGACAFPLVATGQVSAAGRPPMRVAPTHEQLVLQLRKTEQQEANRPPSQVPLSEDASKLEQPGSLMSQSHVLCYGGNLTLVPKRSVLQIPKKYEDRMQAVQPAKVLSFSDFQSANRSWISTFEVSRAQAQGKEPLADEAKTHMSKTGNLIIATYRGNPIEVMPLIIPEANAAGDTAEAQSQSLTPRP